MQLFVSRPLQVPDIFLAKIESEMGNIFKLTLYEFCPLIFQSCFR